MNGLCLVCERCSPGVWCQIHGRETSSVDASMCDTDHHFSGGSARVPDRVSPEKWAMMNRAQRRAYGRKGGKR
jgi:hypothetical protein